MSLTWCIACTPDRPPRFVESGPGLAVQTPESHGAQPGPLRVLHVSPQGPQEKPREIAILFDRPVRALDRDEDGPAGFSIDPPIRGQWTWVGTHAVVFEPEAHEFPLATAFRVKVPEQIVGIDGTRLAQSVGFEFTTARPELWFEGCHEYHPVGPSDTFRVSLSHRTSIAELESAVRVQIRAIGTEDWVNWPLRFLPNERYPERVYRILPKSAWPIGSEIRLSADATLRSLEGTLPAGKSVDATCHTHTAPLANVDCRPSPDDSLCVTGTFATLTFSNPPLNRGLLNTIRIAPPAPFRLRDASAVDLGQLKPNTGYRVTIPRGLRGKFGGRTEQPQTIKFRTAADVRSPHASMGVNGERFEPHLLGPIRIATDGTQDYSVGVRALSAREFLDLRSRQRAGVTGDLRGLLSGHWTHRHFEEVPTKPFVGSLDIKPWLDRSTGAGTLLIDVEPTTPAVIATSPQFESDGTILAVSDLALTTKLWLDGGLAWVTSLSDQRPVADARVSLLHHGVLSPLGVTGVDGLVKVPVEALAGMWAEELRNEGRRQAKRGLWMLLVERGNDWSTLDLTSHGEHVGEGVPEPSARLPRVSLFLDRGVYRLGDKVYVKGYAHQMTAGRSHPLVGRDLAIELINMGDSSHQTLAKRSVRSNGFGAFSTEFELPARLERPRLALGTAVDGQSFGTSILVSETRALEFDVSVTNPQPIVASAPARFRIQGTYLFGDPMRQAKVKWRYSRQRDAFTPPNANQYQTSAAILEHYQGDRSPHAGIPGGEARLSDRGTFDLEQRLEQPPLGPERLTLHAEVFDVARQVVTGHGSVLVHPAGYYLGLKVKATSVHVPAPVDVVALGLDGERLSGKEIDVSLFREADPTEPADLERDEQPIPRLVVVARCQLRSGNVGRGCPLVPRQTGTHVIVAESRDDHGALARAAETVYVTDHGKKPSHESSSDWGPFEPVPLQAELDRATYHKGEVARLTVNSPFDHAWALVTLERDGVYWHEARDIGRRAQFDVPVSEDTGGMAFVNVMALRRGGRKSAYPVDDAIDVAYAHGSVPLRLADDEWRLRVEVSPERAEASPGDTIQCALKVTDRLGKPAPAELTLWAVDEGVLQLTDFRLPDPLGDFAPQQSLLTTTSDSRRSLGWLTPLREGGRGEGIGLGSIGSLGHGTGNGAALPKARRRGPSTVLFQPHLLTDATGRARAAIRVPEQLTRLRVMAVATTERGDFGSSQAALNVRLPLSARPMTPRFARVGDVFEAGVAVSAGSGVKTLARVTAQASGLASNSQSEQRVELEGGRARVVTFRWRADKTGTARLRFDVSTPLGHDAVTVELPIHQIRRPMTVAFYGETASARAERIGPLPRITDKQTKIELSLANTPLVGLSNAIDDLWNYPHACTEQLSSRLLLLGAMQSFARDQGVVLPKDPGEQIRQLVEAILSRQSYEGGFGFWSAERPSVWLTAYATWVLHHASNSGIRGSEAALERAVAYLRDALTREVPGVTDSGRSTQPGYVRAFIADVLAEVAPAEDVNDAIDGLIAQRDALPAFGQAWLLHAMGVAKPARPYWKESAQALTRQLLGGVTITGDHAYLSAQKLDYGEVLDSSERTLALILRALLVHDANHPLTPGLLRGLLAERNQGRWSSTQAAAWALFAIAEYQSRHHWSSSVSDERVWLADASVANTSLDARQREYRTSFAWSPSPGPATLVFEHKGPGKLFYAARLTYEPAEPARTAIARGFEIVHAMAPFGNGDAWPTAKPVLDAATFELGQAVLGEIQLFSSSPRHHVNIELPLPAGLEPIDPRLSPKTDAAAAQTRRPLQLSVERDYQIDVRDERVNFYVERLEPGVSRFEYRARAMTTGSFALPPASVEEMYRPEHHASTAAAKVVITAPRETVRD